VVVVVVIGGGNRGGGGGGGGGGGVPASTLLREVGGKLYGRKKSDYVNGRKGGRQYGCGNGSSAGVASVAGTFRYIPFGVVWQS